MLKKFSSIMDNVIKALGFNKSNNQSNLMVIIVIILMVLIIFAYKRFTKKEGFYSDDTTPEKALKNEYLNII
jgi:hypothetical protein